MRLICNERRPKHKMKRRSLRFTMLTNFNGFFEGNYQNATVFLTFFVNMKFIISL